MIKSKRLCDFINNEMKEFSNHDNVRSIPSLVDGFKDSQRKAVFGMFKHGNSEIRLSQLAGSTALVTAYTHGETSMADTIVGLAQRFPGANNANLFEPIGQFGTILSPESSAHRYIYTKPSTNLRKYIRKEDDLLLEYREEEGEKYEPLSYFPILPMWIVNGAVGIGTGHSVRILPRDPSSVADLVGKMSQGVSVQQKTIDRALTPVFHGWKGDVVSTGVKGQWELHGKFEIVNSTTIRVTELPVTYDVDKYKSILISLMDSGVVKDYDNNSDEQSFDFVITVPREVTKRAELELMNLFKLTVKITENVTLWDVNGKLRRFEDVYTALQEFVQYRLGIYEIRKELQLEAYDDELAWLRNKIQFITYWNTKLKDPHKKTKDVLKAELSKAIDEKFFDRLMALQIASLTMEKIVELEKEVAALEATRAKLEAETTVSLYASDLKEI